MDMDLVIKLRKSHEISVVFSEMVRDTTRS